MSQDKILEFWNQRAELGVKAGSNDYVGKELEIEAIAKHLRAGMRIAEFGCGNGMTAITLAKTHDVHINCFDFSPAMIEAARALAVEAGVADRVDFHVANVNDEPEMTGGYDVIYSQRMVINLADWEQQARAIRYLIAHLRPGGRYLMCENSIDGLENLNDLRARVGLEAISPPWHNVYLRDGAVAGLDLQGGRLVEVEEFMATYYFLSRVVNAWLAKQEGKQPAYDAPVNHLALLLPPMGDCSQTKLWVFERLPA